jgi:hypothetical protein
VVENFDHWSTLVGVYGNPGLPQLQPSQSSRPTGELRAIEIDTAAADIGVPALGDRGNLT